MKPIRMPITTATTAHAQTQPHATLSFVEFVLLTSAMMALTGLSIDIMLPALPAIGAALNVGSENDRQLVVILYMVGFAVGQLFYGPLSDRYGRKPVLLAGLALFLIGTAGAIASQSFTWLLVSRLIQGFGAASPRVIAVAVVRDLYSGRQMARVMSFTMMVFITIPVFAPSIGQALVHLGDWRWVFSALFTAASLIAVWAGLRLPETAQTAGVPISLWDAFVTVLRTPQTMSYAVSGGLMFGCLLAYVASAEQVFVQLFKTGDAFPILFGAIASTMALASFANAGLVERVGMRRVSHIALLAFISVALLLALTAALKAASLGVFAVLLAAEFFLFGLIAPNFNALAMEPHGRSAGMASSIVGSLSTAVGALAGGFIGHAFNGSVLPLALGFAACSLATLAVVFNVEGREGMLGANRPTA